MFSSKAATLEQLINKATDETLTSDNWQYILDVCDSISSLPETNTKNAIELVKKRLTTRDANVILRTLSLVVAMAENCGSRMKQEIATKSFVNDSLVKKLGDRKLHKQVKFKIAEVVQQLHRSFQNDPSLKPMSDAYNVVSSQYSQYLVGSAPSKPAKKKMTAQDKAKEDEELDRVLKLSLQEYEKEQSFKKSYLNGKPLPLAEETLPAQPEPQSFGQSQNQAQTPTQNNQNQPQSQKPVQAQTIATISKVRALYDLISYEPEELSFRKGDIITVIESVYRDWWRGSLPNGKIGIFPLNYVTPVVTKSPQELEQEVEHEDRILASDARKVDKLLALLSSNPDMINEDEVTQLYNEIIPLRPHLAKFIDKYSVRREELTGLHDLLNSEVKVYNELIDNLINRRRSSAPYPTFQTEYPNHQFNPNYEQYQSGQNTNQSTNGNQQQYQNTNQHASQPTSQSPQTNQTNQYPQGQYSQPQYAQDQYNQYPQQLQQQPTSAGFGNANYFPQNQEFTNVNRFPEVNNL